MRKAYSYKRFSTPEQQKGFSTDRQKDGTELYCEKNNLELVASYDDLKGVSAFRGKNTTGDYRLAAFLKDVQAGSVPAGSVLIVESLDRLSRQPPMNVIITIIGPIILAGIDIVTLYPSPKVFTLENMENDQLCLLEIVFMASRANEESRVKSERGKDNWYRKRKEAVSSKPLTCRVVGWVQVAKDKAGQRTTMELIPDRAEVVRGIFADYLSGKGQESIATELNTAGVPCFGKAARWHKSYISKILSNPAVIGTYQAHTLEGRKAGADPVATIPDYYPAIIDPVDYQRVQAIRKGGCVKGQKTEVRNILSNLGRCPLCWGSMTRVDKGKRAKPKLVCSNAKVGAGCVYHVVDYGLVERSLLAGIYNMKSLKPPKGQAAIKAEIVTLTARVNGYKQQLDNTVDAIKAGTMVEELNEMLETTGQLDILEGKHVPATLLDVVKLLEGSITRCTAEIETLQRSSALLQPEIIKARVARLKELVRATDIDRAGVNAVVHELCSEVVIDYPAELLRLRFRFGAEHCIGLDKTI